MHRESGRSLDLYGEQEIGLLPTYWQIGKQVSIVPTSRPGKNF